MQATSFFKRGSDDVGAIPPTWFPGQDLAWANTIKVFQNQAGRGIGFIGRRPGQVAVATAGVVERGGPESESAVAKKGATTNNSATTTELKLAGYEMI